MKKLLALLLCVCMMTSTVVMAYSDVEEGTYVSEAVTILSNLDIVNGFEDGSFKPDTTVTRAEMAKMICRMLGYDDLGSSNTLFTDVTSSHWAAGYVANIAGLGIINGYGDGTFGPEDSVLYEDAVKMIMATLGYTPLANENGGYPAGYLAAANRSGVTENVVGGVVGKPAYRSTIAQLLVNALDTPLMVQSSWNSNGEVEYEIAEGKYNTITGQTEGYKTLMSENLGFVKVRGVVTATSFVNIEDSVEIDTTEKPEVTIEVKDSYGTENKAYIEYYGRTSTKPYYVAGTDAENYLGMSVIAYVKASKGASQKFDIVSITADPSRNNVLTMALDQFVGYNNGEIEYYKEGLNKTTRVEADGKLVFNYTGNMPMSDLNTLVGENSKFGGEIVLIDNDEFKDYDVVFCSLAATGVVKKVTNNSIVLYNNAKVGGKTATKTLYVYPEDETKVVTIYKNGEVIDHTELAEWDVLSIYGSTTRPDVLVAEVVSNEIAGTVTGTKNSKKSADGNAYRINGTWYDVAEGVYDEGIEAGVGGKFYIDEFGKIAAFVEDASVVTGAVGNYGYVIAVKADEAEFGNADACVVKVQMLTTNGIEILEVKNNAKLNGEALKISDWTYTNGNVDCGTEFDFSTFTAIADTVVKYTKDTNGKLATVRTAGYATGVADADFEIGNITTGTYEFDAEDVSLGKAIDPKATIYIKGSTIDEYAVVSAKDLVDLTDYTVVASYQTKKADDADIIVITYDSFNSVGASANVAIISGISTTTDKDGLTVYALDYFQNGEAKYALTTVDVFEDETTLTIGDAVKIKTTNGVITSINFVFDFVENVRDYDLANGSTVTAVNGVAGTDEVFVGGYVDNYTERSEKITFNGSTTEYRLSKAVNVYTIDNTGRELEVTNGGSFTSLSEVLYDETVANVKLVDSKNETIQSSISEDDVKKLYADYVYIRMFEDDVVDVIIIKGYDLIVE